MNNLLTNACDVESHVLVPGRAIMINFEWHAGDHITVLAVYAPTGTRENGLMWADIAAKLTDNAANLPRPDMLLGDFNFVEDPIDRYPAGLNAIDSPASFSDLKRETGLIDGWRNTFPDEVEWTWRNSARSAMSRIDRIYLSRSLNSQSREWKVSITGITKDDHSRLQVDVAHAQAPETGPGRWAMALFLTQDQRFLESVNAKGLQLQDQLVAISRTTRTGDWNAQTLWLKFKTQVTALAKARMRQINCKRD
ncbi:hypothetical protein AURDEDRAFT_75457, partial [Auricularia subglabra TFB-10046 SS5]